MALSLTLLVAGLTVLPDRAAGAPPVQATPASVQPAPTSTPVRVGVPGAATPAPGATPGQTAGPSGPVAARISYPPTGQIIALQPFLVQFEMSGIRLDASLIGEPSVPGVGQWLLLVDGVEVAAGDSGEVFVSGLPPGSHQVALQIRNNDRSPLVPPVGSAIEVCIEVCTEEVIPPILPEVPGGLPRTGTGGLASR